MKQMLKELKGHLIATCVASVGFIVVGCMAVKAEDQEWLINYSKATGIPVEEMRLVDDMKECEPHDIISEKYGVCYK